MSHESPNPQRSDTARAYVELDLVQTLLSSQPSAYPWNPSYPEAEGYFDGLEQAIDWNTWSMEDLTYPVPAFNQCFARVEAHSPLMAKFVAQIPPHLLKTITEQIQGLMATNLTIAEQLVRSVQTILPHWDAEDLQVFARPLAYAMRDDANEAIDTVLGAVRPVSWSDLSDVEQARLSLAAARYVLDQWKRRE